MRCVRTWLAIVMAMPALPEAVAAGEEVESAFGMPATSEELATAAEPDGLLDADVAALGGQGAVVSNEIRARGQLVRTPSGNQHLICHVQPPPRLFVLPPTDAIVVREFTRAVGSRRTRESQLIVTPRPHVHATCHITPAAP